MDVSFSNLPEVIREFRILWLNIGIGGLAIIGLIGVGGIVAWQSPKLLSVWLEHRRIKADHSRRARVENEKISRERERRLAKDRSRRARE